MTTIPISIEGERRLKDGTRTATFSLSKEFARAFFDMQERASEKGQKIGLSIMDVEQATVQSPLTTYISEAQEHLDKASEILTTAREMAGEGEDEKA